MQQNASVRAIARTLDYDPDTIDRELALEALLRRPETLIEPPESSWPDKRSASGAGA